MRNETKKQMFPAGDDWASEAGITLIEVLFAVLFTAIVAMGLTRSTLMSYTMYNETRHDSVAMQLAARRLEELTALNPELLTDALDSTESELVIDGMSFTRITDVTINPDRSRSVEVVVRSNVPSINSEVVLRNSFALWGSR